MNAQRKIAVFLASCVLLTCFPRGWVMADDAGAPVFPFSLLKLHGCEMIDDPLLVRAALLAGWKLEEDDDDWYASPLMYAATPEVAQIMLDAGADVNARPFHGGTVLFWVRDARMAKFFVDAGAEVNVCNMDGFTPLMCSPDGDVTEVLLKAGAEADSAKLPTRQPPDATALHFAPDAKAVRLLIAAGVAVDAHAERIPLTPLCCARNAEVTRALLAAGADACFQAKNGFTPLHHAQDAESVRLLLEAGADVNACTESGVTPLLVAAADVYPYSYTLSQEGHLWGSHYCYRNEMEDVEYEAENAYDEEDEGALSAADRDQIARVRLLLAAGAKVNVATKEGLTPLMVAGQPEVVKLLLDAGASVVGFGPGGKTALHLAKTPEKVQLLLDAGANVHARDLESRTPLFDAQFPESIQVLLAAGADVRVKNLYGETPLFFATNLRSVECLLAAMRKSGMDDAAMKAALNTRAKTGRTAVTALCEHFKEPALLELLRLLVPAGADVNTVGTDGRTPLFYASRTQTVQYLLAAGTRVDVHDKERWTPLHGVLSKGADTEAVRRLLAAGADVNAETKDGQTPLEVLSGHPSSFSPDTPGLTKLLLDAGARVNRKEDFVVRMTNTALHEMNNPEAALMLIAAGADVNAVGKDGKTPLHTQRFSPEVMQALIAAGGDIHARDTEGKTPLFHAYETPVARVLLEAGADVNARDTDGRTPYFMARTQAVRDVLVQAGADPNAVDNDGHRAFLWRDDEEDGPGPMDAFLGGDSDPDWGDDDEEWEEYDDDDEDFLF